MLMPPDQTQPVYFEPEAQQDSNKTRRLIIGVTGLVVFIFIVIVAVLLIFSGPDHRLALGEITASQQELSRVSELGLDSKRARESTKNFAANVQAVTSTHVFDISELISNNYGLPLAPETINSATNSSIDEALDSAELSSNIDGKFIEVMKALLQESNQKITAQIELTEDQPTLDVLSTVLSDNLLLLDSI
jgi:hypothetical protein